MKFFKIILIPIILLFISQNSQAKEPDKILLGVYVNSIHMIDLKEGTADVDMYMWTRSKTKKDYFDSLEIMNGTIKQIRNVHKKVVDGEFYAIGRFRMETLQNYKLKNFPLDDQFIKIAIENSTGDYDDIEFVPDLKDSGISEVVDIPGWDPMNLKITERKKIYDSNFGDPEFGLNDETSMVSRIDVEVLIDQTGAGYFLKLFGTVFLSAFIGFLAFYISAEDIEPKFSLGVGGIFSVVASNFVLSSMLPETPQMTLAEFLLLFTMGTILLSIVETIYSRHLWVSGKQAKSKLVDLYVGIFVPIIYVLLCFIIVKLYLSGYI
jgi:hypothetical protein